MSILFNSYYSLVLIFSKDLNNILLKNIGGKLDGIMSDHLKNGIAEQELSIKINQDTGLEINPSELKIVTSLSNINKEWNVDVYMIMVDLDKSKSIENLVKIQTNKIEDCCHPNLKWLIPLCLDISVHGSSFNQILMK